MKVAIIGYGYWGKILRYYIEKNSNFSLVKIYDPELKTENIFSNKIDDILKKDIKAVFICTPINTHFSLSKLMLNNNKHVFCEKPLAKNSKNIEELIKISKKREKVIQTDFTFLQSKSIKKMKELNLKIGQIYYTYFSMKQFGKFYKEDNVYEILASHMISILYYLFKKNKFDFKFIDYYLNKENKSEIGDIVFHSKNLNGKISVSLLNPYKERKIIIKGEKGILYYNPLENISLKYYSICNNILKLSETFNFDEKNNLLYAMDYFYKIINEQEESNIDISKKVTAILGKYSIWRKDNEL